ncbi:hypothetical protein [Trueperella pyogenes]
MTQIIDAHVGREPVQAIYIGRDLVWRARPPVLKGVTASTVIRGQTRIEVYPSNPDQVGEWLSLAGGATLRIGDETIPIERAHLDSYDAVYVILKGRVGALYEAFTPVEAQP